ncbi:MAG: hypothetical protein CM1200mP15_07130 [Dehalococcoidia bacterium]|nr:MAG: hypothetical protein CM1200mP15_07130 [Dehalococcoidia bacterium]
MAAKDVRLATDLGREYGIPMELSNLVDQRHVEAMFRGWGPEGFGCGFEDSRRKIWRAIEIARLNFYNRVRGRNPSNDHDYCP